MEYHYGDNAGFNMSSADFKETCRESWKSEDYLYFFDRPKKKSEGVFVTKVDQENTECTPEPNSFYYRTLLYLHWFLIKMVVNILQLR